MATDASTGGSGITRAKALILGVGIFAMGGLGYWAFAAAGLEGFSAGIAAQAVLVLVVLGWTGSYLFRVVTGNMTYMQQRRRYRDAYDSATDEELQRRFEALPPAEQERLLRELGQLDDNPKG